MNNQQLLNRIKRLEMALADAGLPSSDMVCECCHTVYVPFCHDSCRCRNCITTCKKVNDQWIKGFLCPDMRRIQY